MSASRKPLAWKPLPDGWFEHRFAVASEVKAADLCRRLEALASACGCAIRTEASDGVVALQVPESAPGFEVMAQLAVRCEDFGPGDDE